MPALLAFRRSRVLALTAGLVLAAPGVASADAPWSAPAAAGTPTTGYEDLAIDHAAGGAGAYGASIPNARFPLLPGVGRLGRLSAGGTAGTLRDREDDLVAGPIAYATASFAILTTKLAASSTDTFRPRIDVRVAFGSTSTGRTGTATTLARGIRVTSAPALAINGRGEAAAAWIEDRSDVSDRLWLALRRPGQAFATPTVVLGKGNLSDVDLDYGEGGDLVVAAVRNLDGQRRIVARVRRAGHNLGDVQDLGPNRGVATVRAAMAATGRAVVAWGTQDGGIEANLPYRVYAAVKPAGPRSFRAEQLVDEAAVAEYTAGPPHLGIAADGTATLAWSMPARVPSGTTFPVRTSTTDASAVFRAPAGTDASGVVTDVGVGADGATVVPVSGVGPDGFPGEAALALVRAPGASSFAAAERIAAGPVNLGGPVVSFDTRGRVVALWSATVAAGRQLQVAIRPPISG